MESAQAGLRGRQTHEKHHGSYLLAPQHTATHWLHSPRAHSHQLHGIKPHNGHTAVQWPQAVLLATSKAHRRSQNTPHD
eukprot:917073-Pelagomonas_calceolata.AAC.4